MMTDKAVLDASGWQSLREQMHQHAFAVATDADPAMLRIAVGLADFALKQGYSFAWFNQAMTSATSTDQTPPPNKHALAVEVMELLATFIQSDAPDLMPDLVRVLERFTPYLAERLS